MTWWITGPALAAMLVAGAPPDKDAPGRAGPPRVLVKFDTPVTCLAWSADGRRVAAGAPDGTVHIIEAATGKVRAIPTFKGDAITALALSPDGKVFAAFNSKLRLSKWDADTGEQWGGYLECGHEVDCLAFLANGNWVIGASPNAAIKIQLVKKGPSEGVGRGGPNLVEGGCSAVAPDGAAMTSCWPNRPVGVLRAGPGDRSEFGDDTSLDVGNARCLALGPGGKLLVVGTDDGVHLWEVAAKRKTQSLAGLDQPATRLTVSGDGRTLVAVAADGTSVVAWDLPGGTARCRIGHTRGPVGALALSPDGKLMATAVREGNAILLWKVEARELAHRGPGVELSAKDLAAAWDDLASPDGATADAAWRRLGAAGDTAVGFLAERIRPVAVPAVGKNIERLVADLDSGRFATRERAAKELEAAGELAVGPLRRLVERPPSAEAKARADELLKKLVAQPPTPVQVRALEAIDLLEQLRTAKAVALLQEIERDGQVPRLRTEVGRALRRIAGPEAGKK
jgi:hypothetical protein